MSVEVQKMLECRCEEYFHSVVKEGESQESTIGGDADGEDVVVEFKGAGMGEFKAGGCALSGLVISYDVK